MASLVFYLGSFIVSALLMWYGTERKNKVMIGLGLLAPILIGGLRFGVGTDFGNYVTIYNNLSHLSLDQYFALQSIDMEIGFYLLMKLSNFITSNYVFMFVASSFLTVLFFYLGLRRFNVKHSAIVYFLFLTISFPFSLNGVRQAIAVSICFYAFSFIMQRQWKRYITWVVVASLFHQSALILLPFYFINRLLPKTIVNDKKKIDFTLLKVFALAAVVFLLLPYVYSLLEAASIFGKYSTYQTIAAEGNNYIFYLKVALLGAVLLFYKRIIARNPKHVFFFILIVLDIVLSTLGFVSPFIKRIALYFSLFSPLLLTPIIDVFSDKLGKFLSIALLITYGLAYFYLAYYVLGQSEIFPYQTIIGETL